MMRCNVVFGWGPENSHGWRSLVGYILWGRKESDTTEATKAGTCLPPSPQPFLKADSPMM